MLPVFCVLVLILIMLIVRIYAQASAVSDQFDLPLTMIATYAGIPQVPVILPTVADTVPIVLVSTASPQLMSSTGAWVSAPAVGTPQSLLITCSATQRVVIAAPMMFDTTVNSVGESIVPIFAPTYTAVRLLPGYVYKCTAEISAATCDLLYRWYSPAGPFGIAGVFSGMTVAGASATVSNLAGMRSTGYIRNATTLPIYVFLVCVQSAVVAGYNPNISKVGNVVYGATANSPPWALIEAIYKLP